MHTLADEIRQLAIEELFDGVVCVDVGDERIVEQAHGLADRAHGIANTFETRFGIASGAKGFTALTVMRLVELGLLRLDTTARSFLGDHLPLIADEVTVEHLLGHRSGIGDYLDEDEVGSVNDHVMPVPVHLLDTTESYLAVLDGHATVFPAGERFAYCNGGFVLLALLVERATGVAFHELVDSHVCAPAGLTDTAYLRSDELPGTAAVGYLHTTGLRTNVLHLPVRGSGDGGIHATADDIHSLWRAVMAGRVVSPVSLTLMTTPRSDAPDEHLRYGLGFWLHERSDALVLTGSDAGVSFWSTHDPATQCTATVISNSSGGAWPIAQRLRAGVDAQPGAA